MIEHIDFESIRLEIIETFETLKRKDSFFTYSEGVKEILSEQSRLQGLLRIGGEYDFFSKNQVIELSCLINDLQFEYMCIVTLNRFTQLDNIMPEIEQDVCNEA
jgi:hypothetical protein